ncbi:replicative DNA helicase [Pseudomonas aeruginosa]|nr:replicative DNA helicase [Pseudomonas aeruginosa]
MSVLELTPPHSVEAEQGVLGGLMLDNAAWDIVGDQLQKEDFFRHEHRLIFTAISELAAKDAPFDVVTVSEAIEDLPEAGGLAYLGQLADNTPSVANIEAYAQIVRDRAHLRQLMSLGHHCTRTASNHQANPSEVQEEIEQKLFALGQDQHKSDFVDINKGLAKIVDTIDYRFNNNVTVTGVPTGLKDLDELSGGLQKSDLIIVGARPSMGKTSFALNLIDAALQSDQQKSVQVYSMEMPAEQLLFRLAALLGHLDLGKLMKGQLQEEDWPRLSLAIQRINDYGSRLVINDQSNLTPTELRAKVRRAARKYGHPVLILVDYLQLMRCPGLENRATEISEISRSLKALAKEMDCPVVALSQLNRGLENRPNKRPNSADLRESGAIEQDADVIMFVYRDEVYHPNTEAKGIAEIIIGKYRNGPIGTVHTAFIANQTRFADLAPTWQGALA